MKRTKIEGTAKGNRYSVRQVFIDSGKVFRVLLDAKADNNQSAVNQLLGATEYFKAQSNETNKTRV